MSVRLIVELLRVLAILTKGSVYFEIIFFFILTLIVGNCYNVQEPKWNRPRNEGTIQVVTGRDIT